MKRFFILDGHSILHRAYHALPSFVSQKGLPTGGLYGFSAILLKIIKELKPDYFAAAYDLSAPTFRHLVYKQYKAQRPATENELAVQINPSKEILKCFGIPVYEKEGYEADDIIGTITEKLKKEDGLEIIIGSSDLDFLQLAENKRVKIYTLKRGLEETVIYDASEVKKRFGFEPGFLPDFKALKGDPSDNIPGVKGIGEKTATHLIQKFGHLENILEKAKNEPEKLTNQGLNPKVAQLLKNYEEQALLSKELAKIQTDAPIDFSAQQKKFEPKKEEVIKIFQEFGFKTLIDRFAGLDNKQKIRPIKELLTPEQKEAILMFWLLDSRRVRPSLKELSDYYNQRTFEEIYAELKKEISDQGLEWWFQNVEIPLFDILKKMEETGTLIDKQGLKKLDEDYKKESETAKNNIWDLVGENFNINSPKEVGQILFEKLKIPAKGLKKTPGGKVSTKLEELEKISHLNPVITKIIQAREAAKIQSSFLKPFSGFIAKDGRLHPNFSQTGTVTGRLSCENPNLQNVPEKIRKIFIAENDFKLVSFDYSQIELRILAISSKDKNLVEAFEKNKDIHRLMASKIFNLPEEEISSEMRQTAKTINFGIIYGMGKQSLSQRLKISPEEAQIFLEDYFQNFPGIKIYLENIISEAKKNSYVSTIFNRKRYLPEINSPIAKIQAEAHRRAVNLPIQGSSADFIKLAMVKIDEFLKKEGLEKNCRLILQIHDELLFEIKENLIHNLIPEIKKIMESAYKSDIAIMVDVKEGYNWGELKS